jgi:hydrogenase 3 maturation protease
MGLGNVDYGDDGFGVRLAETLTHSFGVPASVGSAFQTTEVWHNVAQCHLKAELETIAAGTEPEHFIGRVVDERFDHLIFLDAVEFGGAPGSVVFLDGSEMAARFPQISTHKISLGTLAHWVEASGKTRAWLLGVQPKSVRPGSGLTPNVQQTLEILAALLSEIHARAFVQSAVLPAPGPRSMATL